VDGHLRQMFVGAILLVTLAAGCTTQAGLAEFQAYKRTFDEGSAVSTALIDKLAASERAVMKFARASRDLNKEFKPEDAAYYVEGADPPLAAVYRKAIRSINAYNELLLAYVTGAAGKQLHAQVQLLASELVAFASVTPASSAAFPGLANVASRIVEFAAVQRSRAAFQAEFRRTSPLVVELIDEMRAKTPTVFKNLTYFTAAKYEDVVDQIEPGNPEQLHQEFEQSRVLLSGWVLLLERQKLALLQTQRAVDNPTLGVVLSGATESIAELRITVNDVRAELAK
jgi:hypothetical protein